MLKGKFFWASNCQLEEYLYNKAEFELAAWNVVSNFNKVLLVLCASARQPQVPIHVNALHFDFSV